MTENRLTQEQGRHFSRNHCQLTQLPLLNQNLVALSLSHNRIASLGGLPSLCCLRSIDLSHNLITRAHDLQPLPQSAPNLVSLDLRGNPMTSTLNFVFDLALLFSYHSPIALTSETGSIQLNQTLLEEGARLHYKGPLLRAFLLGINQWGDVARSGDSLAEVEKIVQRLAERNSCAWQLNRIIFSCIHQFFSLLGGPREIQVLQEYTLGSGCLERGFSEEEDLLRFYYNQMVNSPGLQLKLIQELEVDQQLHQMIEQGQVGDPLLLLPAIRDKWQTQLRLIQQQQILAEGLESVLMEQTPQQLKTATPFKSAQTKATSHRDHLDDCHSHYYFGLDLEWALQTQQFVLHRLVSLLRQLEHRHQSQPCTPRLTFQPFCSPEVKEWEPSSGELGMRSPVSRNRVLLSSCLSVLEGAVTRIVFNRLSRTKAIKKEHLIHFSQLFQQLRDSCLVSALRKISQAALYYTWLDHKMQMSKIKKVFAAWKQLKKRKLKLLKDILKRKTKKEKAFLSVAITQWRITARMVATQLRLRRQQEPFRIATETEVTSTRKQPKTTILRRSGTLNCLRPSLRRAIR